LFQRLAGNLSNFLLLQRSGRCLSSLAILGYIDGFRGSLFKQDNAQIGLAIVASQPGCLLRWFWALFAILGFQVVRTRAVTCTRPFLRQITKDFHLPFTEKRESSYSKSGLNSCRVASQLGDGLRFMRRCFQHVLDTHFLRLISLTCWFDDWPTSLDFALLRLVPARSRQHFDHRCAEELLGFLRGQMILVRFSQFQSFVAFTVLGVNSLCSGDHSWSADAIPGIRPTLEWSLISSLVFVTQLKTVAARSKVFKPWGNDLLKSLQPHQNFI